MMFYVNFFKKKFLVLLYLLLCRFLLFVNEAEEAGFPSLCFNSTICVFLLTEYRPIWLWILIWFFVSNFKVGDHLICFIWFSSSVVGAASLCLYASVSYFFSSKNYYSAWLLIYLTFLVLLIELIPSRARLRYSLVFTPSTQTEKSLFYFFSFSFIFMHVFSEFRVNISVWRAPLSTNRTNVYICKKKKIVSGIGIARAVVMVALLGLIYK